MPTNDAFDQLLALLQAPDSSPVAIARAAIAALEDVIAEQLPVYRLGVRGAVVIDLSGYEHVAERSRLTVGYATQEQIAQTYVHPHPDATAEAIVSAVASYQPLFEYVALVVLNDQTTVVTRVPQRAATA